MRTTLDIEDDVLQAVQEIAQSAGTTVGQVASELLRRGLQETATPARVRNGVSPMTRWPGAPVTTLALVNELRDE